jgi:hypothetical protein
MGADRRERSLLLQPSSEVVSKVRSRATPPFGVNEQSSQALLCEGAGFGDRLPLRASLEPRLPARVRRPPGQRANSAMVATATAINHRMPAVHSNSLLETGFGSAKRERPSCRKNALKAVLFPTWPFDIASPRKRKRRCWPADRHAGRAEVSFLQSHTLVPLKGETVSGCAAAAGCLQSAEDGPAARMAKGDRAGWRASS